MLQPGTSALVAVVKHEWVDQVREALADEAVNVMTAELSGEIVTTFTEGNEYGFTAVITEDGIVAGEAVANAGAEAEAEGQADAAEAESAGEAAAEEA